jgi:hypothetical protein
MKRLVTAALSAIMLISCGTRSSEDESSTQQARMNVTEIEITNNTSSAPKKLTASTIIYREKLYNIYSDIKSDLIIQSDGRVWCGFYTNDEGSIDRFNRLWTDDKEYLSSYQLQDDLWLDTVLTETKKDDFMPFDDIIELAKLDDSELEKLTSLIGSIDPYSASSVYTASENAAAPDIIETEYSFIDMIIGSNICRAYEYTQSYQSMIQDETAAEVIDLIHGNDYYSEWREKCSENLLPRKDSQE